MSNQIGSLKMGQKLKKTPAGEIPVDWGCASLSSVANIIMGQSPESSACNDKGEGIPFYQGNADFGRVYPVPSSWCTSPTKLAKEGDILISVRAPVGEINIASHDCCVGRGLSAIRPTEANSKYLYYALFSSSKAFDKLAQGSTFKAINGGDLIDLPIALPSSRHEQEKIGQILWAIDENIGKAVDEIKKTKELKKGLMLQLLTRGIGHKKFKKTIIGQIPGEWGFTPLGELAEVRRGASPRPIDDAKYFGDGPGWVRIADVTRSVKYLRTTAQKLSQLGVESSVLVKPGDVIMSICATIGKPVILDMQACIHDGFVFFDKLSKRIVNEYLYYFLQFKEAEFASSGQPGAQKNLNIDIVSRMLVPLPRLKEQKEILSIVSALDDDIESSGTLHKKALEFKKGLMKVLLTGKVRTSPQ